MKIMEFEIYNENSWKYSIDYLLSKSSKYKDILKKSEYSI